jgi:lipid-binding SYLF domain-containing protein
MTTEQKSIWSKAARGSKLGFDKLWGYADKLGAPVNKITNKIGSEAFWPTSIDKESYKAARILRSFCKDGIYTEETTQSEDGPKQQQKILKKIPAEVIKNAKGLAIFTTMRTGLWFSGAGGSGIVVARLPDGSWSPPSGILLHTAGIGFLVGVDIYDCVLVLNSEEAVSAFSKWRATVGGEISAVAGPVGVGGILETELHKRQAPIFTYLRSRGFYAGVQIDGTVIIERTDENEKFYGHRYSATEILGGKIRHPPFELKTLTETLKAAQGDTNVDESLLPTEPPPADFEVVKSDAVFSVPDPEDPDPYGVLALEKEGLLVKQAGSQQAAAHEEFDFKPALTSPVFATYNKNGTRGSFESSTHRTSWRSSGLSVNSGERPKYVTMDIATQTDFPSPPTSQPTTPALPSTPEKNNEREQALTTLSPFPVSEQITPTQVHKIPPPLPTRALDGTRHLPPPLPLRVNPSYATTSTSTASPASNQAPASVAALPAATAGVSAVPKSPVLDDVDLASPDEDGEFDLSDDEDASVQVVEVQQVRAQPLHAMRPQVIRASSGARVVTVGPRATPALPSRNPSRAFRAASGAMSLDGDAADGTSTMASDSTRGSATSASPTSPEHERKESVTSQEGSMPGSIKRRTSSVRSTQSYRSTHSMASPKTNRASSIMPGGFTTVNEPTPPSPPSLHIPDDEEDLRPFTHSPVDPRTRISMSNMRLGLISDDEDDARSPSPGGPRKFSMIQTPVDDEHMQFASM